MQRCRSLLTVRQSKLIVMSWGKKVRTDAVKKAKAHTLKRKWKRHCCGWWVINLPNRRSQETSKYDHNRCWYCCTYFHTVACDVILPSTSIAPTPSSECSSPLPRNEWFIPYDRRMTSCRRILYFISYTQQFPLHPITTGQLQQPFNTCVHINQVCTQPSETWQRRYLAFNPAYWDEVIASQQLRWEEGDAQLIFAKEN